MTTSIVTAVARMLDSRSARGLAIEPRAFVMSGAIFKMIRSKVGDEIRATFAGLGSVSVNVVA